MCRLKLAGVRTGIGKRRVFFSWLRLKLGLSRHWCVLSGGVFEYRPLGQGRGPLRRVGIPKPCRVEDSGASSINTLMKGNTYHWNSQTSSRVVVSRPRRSALMRGDQFGVVHSSGAGGRAAHPDTSSLPPRLPPLPFDPKIKYFYTKTQGEMLRGVLRRNFLFPFSVALEV